MKTSMLNRLEDAIKVRKPKKRASSSIDAKTFSERVEKKAYELYQRRGYKSGQDWQDWFDAEKLVEDELIAEK